MRVVFAGTPDTAVPSLDALLGSRHEVLAVISRPDAPAGRGRVLTASPVTRRAEAAGLEVLRPERPSDPDFQARLVDIDPDICAVVAYGALVPPAALAIPPLGWVNLHFSLLPRWRGAAPVQRSLIAGDDVTGASTFRLEQGMDTGPVFGVMTTSVGDRETAGELLGRLAVDGAGLLVATLDGIEDGTVQAVRQPSDGVSLAPKLRPEDARVDWTTAAVVTDRQVRGCTPAPGSWTTFRDGRVRLGPVTPVAGRDDDPRAAGELWLRDGVVLVATGDVPVALDRVQPAGRAEMAASDWVRGLRLEPGDAFR